jgi:hypothetical protein
MGVRYWKVSRAGRKYDSILNEILAGILMHKINPL